MQAEAAQGKKKKDDKVALSRTRFTRFPMKSSSEAPKMLLDDFLSWEIAYFCSFVLNFHGFSGDMDSFVKKWFHIGNTGVHLAVYGIPYAHQKVRQVPSGKQI